MKLSPYIQQFIETHISLIDENKFDELYDAWCNELAPYNYEYFESVYRAFLDAGIDMLLFIDEIPQEFFMGYVGGELIIPDNIKKLQYNAFREANIDSLILPPSITLAENYLFEDVFISEVKWLGSPKLSDSVFVGIEDGHVDKFIINKGSSIDLALREFENPDFEIEYI